MTRRFQCLKARRRELSRRISIYGLQCRCRKDCQFISFAQANRKIESIRERPKECRSDSIAYDEHALPQCNYLGSAPILLLDQELDAHVRGGREGYKDLE